jgi:hypothetical protein
LAKKSFEEFGMANANANRGGGAGRVKKHKDVSKLFIKELHSYFLFGVREMTFGPI